MDLTLGVDSGTQSTKVVVCDPAGAVVASGHAAHSGACVEDPENWWRALIASCRQIPEATRGRVRGMSVAAQQHGCVPLGAGAGRPVIGPARLWCDTTSATEADRLNRIADFATEVASRLVASFTITKLASIPEASAAVCLPHDWLTWRLTGSFVTDRGDASDTGWWSAGRGTRHDLLELAGYRDLEVPMVAGPDDAAGFLLSAPAAELGLPAGITVAAGTGDNMATALGIGARVGEVIVSLGTSGTVFGVSENGTHDPDGIVAGFADGTGRFLPLVCTLNCTVPVNVIARWFGISVAEALDRASGPTELTFLPYLRGERTPNLPRATGAVIGLAESTTHDDLLAAVVQGVAAGLADGLAALEANGLRRPDSIRLVGGGARHPTWGQARANAAALPVEVVDGEDHTARGAALQARAVVDGATVRQVAEYWRPGAGVKMDPGSTAAPEIPHSELLRALSPLWGAAPPAD
jgi:xylulokinase